jgi:hypothetical protein
MSMKRTATVGLVVLALALVGAGAGYAVSHGRMASPTASSSDTSASSSAPSAVLPPGGQDPTGTTVPARDSAQPTSGQTVATDTPSVVTASTVPVVVTYSGWNAAAKQAMAGGYVTGVIETGGTCTLTLTRAGVQVTSQGHARPDAATTACGGLTVPGAKLSVGTWKAVLSYVSATSSGSSAPVDIAVTP